MKNKNMKQTPKQTLHLIIYLLILPSQVESYQPI